MIVPRKQKSARRNETAQLTHPIRVALNRLPGVRFARNNNLGPVVPWAKRLLPDVRPVIAGLGDGSADLVGIERMVCPCCGWGPFGRATALEVKWPDVEPDEHQITWLAEVRKLGGFAAVVHSIEEALAAVERCRSGESQ